MLDAFTTYDSFLKQKYGLIWCYVRYINWITFESGICDKHQLQVLPVFLIFSPKELTWVFFRCIF